MLLALLLAASPTAQAMAFNVEYDAAKPDDSLAVISQAQPDFVCLEELTQTYAKNFEARLGAQFPQRAFSPKKDGTWGIGLASKLPIVSNEVFAQSPSKMPAVQAVLRATDRELVVLCVHLFPSGAKRKKGESALSAFDENAKLREQQARKLLERLTTEKRAIVLLGDFNETEAGDAMQVLLHAGFTRASTGATWPADRALPAIFGVDHILVRGASTSDARTITGGSDHKAVLAKIELPAR